MLEIEQVKSLISTEEIFDSEPVFVGTRVPVRTVVAFLEQGESVEAILDDFPSLTAEMVAVAPLWAKLHPMKARPRKFGEINPDWTVIASKTIKLNRS